MATYDNQRFYPVRNPDDPRKVTLEPITEEQYQAIYPEIWRIRKREQHHGRCLCPHRYLWKCDADCELCEYHAAGDTVSLDAENTESGMTLGDELPSNEPPIDQVLADRDLLERLFTRLREIDPEADTIIQLWRDHPDGISDRKVAEALGRKQRTFADEMKKVRTEFRKIRGY